MINWVRWSEIEVVILPEKYLKDGLFAKMLSICVVICVPLFLIIIDKIHVKNTCEYGAFIFIMDCIKHIFEMIVSKNRQYFLIICAESNIIFYRKETWSFLKG